jgi:hypothetical protein
MKIYHFVVVVVSSPPHAQRVFKGYSPFVEGVPLKSDAVEIKDAIVREYSADNVVPDHNR